MNIIYSRIKLLINIEWAWSQIFEFSNFDDGILEQEGTVCYLQSNSSQI